MPAIYTRTGDKGTTGLFGGSRVIKQSLRVEAYGTVDEANAALGAAKAGLEPGPWRDRIHAIQQRMFVAGAELASDAKGAEILANKISTADIEGLEHLIDDCLAITGPQRSFVVPGRDEVSAPFHVARTVVRRAERRCLTLAEHEPVRPELIKFLNRLSDAVYSVARLTETWYELAHVEQVVRDTVARYWPQLDGSLSPSGSLSLSKGPEPVEGEGVSTGSTRFDKLNDPAETSRWAAMRAHCDARTPEALLRLAKELAEGAEKRAAQLGVAMVIVVVDAAGNQVLLHRMPGSLIASLEIAANKAWSANAFKMPTADLGPLAAEGGALPGLAGGNSGRVVLFGGGVPLIVDGAVIGALGISGGTVDEDCDVATYALTTVMGAQK